jgi:hypothetical protein
MSSFLTLLKKILQRGEQEVRIVIPVRSLDAETDRRLYSIALDLEKPLRSRIESTVSSEQVKLTRIEIRPGGVEFWITFLAAYELVSKHEDLERFGSQMIERISAIIQGQFSEVGIHDLKLVGPSSKR